jgi:hypothetical protein
MNARVTRSRFGWAGRLCAAAIAVVITSMTANAGGTPNEVLLIPNSASTARTVMAFDAHDGNLIDAEFIPNPGSIDGLTLNRPLHAIASPWGTILLSDQLRHVVFEFEFDGTPIRVFAPSGGQNSTVLNNIRGMAVAPDGTIMVSNSGPSAIVENDHSIVQFSQQGEETAKLIFQRYGGIRGPFDVLVLEDMILVSADLSNAVMRYTTDGKFAELFATGVQFPMQLAESSSGTILLAVSSGGFIREYDRDGTIIGTYTAGMGSFRGVAELGNGNLLVTNNTGVHEITRTNQLVETKFAGSEMRYIERVTLPEGLAVGRNAEWHSEGSRHQVIEASSGFDTDASRDSGMSFVEFERGERNGSHESEFTSARADRPIQNPELTAQSTALNVAMDADLSALPMREASSSLGDSPYEIYIIEDSGFFGAPGITAGTIGKLSVDDPSQVTIIGNDGGHLGPFNWGGIDFRPNGTGAGTAPLYGFENTTNSIRIIDPDANDNTLIDSTGYIESGSFVAGFAISNDGSIGYAAGTVGFQGRIVQADLDTGEVLSVHAFGNFPAISSVAVVPEGTDLPFDAGTIFALRNISGGIQLVQFDLDTNTATVQGTVSGLGFTGAFESGLDFAPNGTLYAAINGVSGGNDVSTRLFTINPQTAAATLVGIIGNDGEWDAASIAVVPAITCAPADLNCDGVVNVSDLLLLFDAWGDCDDCDDCPADFNSDCTVNVSDLLFMFDNWG